VASTEIERLPRVGSDLRVMINAIRRKTHTSVDETGVESDSRPIDPTADVASNATAVHGREAVDTLVRRSDQDDDKPEPDPSDRRREG